MTTRVETATTKEVTGAEALVVVEEAVVRQAQEPASSVDKKVQTYFREGSPCPRLVTVSVTSASS